jgi:hypothetical protein
MSDGDSIDDRTFLTKIPVESSMSKLMDTF